MQGLLSNKGFFFLCLRSCLSFLLPHMFYIENLEHLEMHEKKAKSFLDTSHSGKSPTYSGAFPSSHFKIVCFQVNLSLFLFISSGYGQHEGI